MIKMMKISTKMNEQNDENLNQNDDQIDEKSQPEG